MHDPMGVRADSTVTRTTRMYLRFGARGADAGGVRRTLRILAPVALATLVAFVVASTPIGHHLELDTVDARYQHRGAQASHALDEVAVLEIDDTTDALLKQRWPYRRSVHASMLRSLADAGARAAVLDIQLLDPSDRADDAALVNAIAEVEARGMQVVLATGSDANRGGVPLPFSGIDSAFGDRIGTRFERSGASIGISDAQKDIDGGIRRLAPKFAYRAEEASGAIRRVTFDSLALAAVRAGGHDVDRSIAATTAPQQLSWSLDGNRQRRADQVATRNYADAVGAKGATLAPFAQNRVVFVGATSAVLHDDHPTPIDGSLPGVYVSVQGYLDLRDGHMLRSLPARWGIVLAALVAGLVGLLAVLRRGRSAWIWIGLGLPIAWISFAWWAFGALDLVLPVAAPALGMLAALVLVIVHGARHAMRERRHVASVFSRYVSPRIVRELLADNLLDVRPGGTSREVTILMSDVRGFTSMSAGMEPDVLVAQLNDYFEEMVAAVDEHEGTVDKFMGDGLMAFFGAPAHQPDHARRACDTALEMLERLTGLNERRRLAGLQAIEIGIGLATGRVVVGNVGSERRLEFTVIGDAVNLAARLEGVTKRLGVPIVIAESTARELPEESVVDLGTIEVRGIQQPVRIATLAAAAHDSGTAAPKAA
jgi:adenylate cyclase